VVKKIGGLVSSTLLNVFAVPCVYLFMGGERPTTRPEVSEV